MLFRDKNIRNQLRQISFKIDLRTNERRINERREREREGEEEKKSRELLYTKRRSEWMAVEEKKRKKDSV